MKFLLFLIALFYNAISFCQINKEVDSLLKAADIATEDTNRLLIYNRIGSYYIDNNPGKAIEYFEKSVVLCKQTNQTLRLANTFYDLGFCYLLKGDFDKSLDNYQQASKIYEQLKDKRRLVNALTSIGNLFSQNKAIEKANDYYDKAEVLILQTKDSNQLSTLYAERGMLYDQTKRYDTALIYLQKGLEIAKLINDENLIVSSYSNIGLTYKHKKNTPLALQYFDTVVKMYTAMLNTPLDYIAGMYNNIGAAHAQAGSYDKAIVAFNKSIDIAVQENISGIEMENYRNMADMYGDMKNYQQQNIFLKKYYNLKDSLFSIDNKNQLTQLEADYQLEKKNISLVKQESETAKQKNQRNLFIIIAIGAALLLAALAFFYRRIKQNNVLLQEKNTQINKQKDELQTLNHVKDKLFSVISHDLRNPLVTLKSYLSLANSATLTEEKKEQFRLQTHQAVSQTSTMLDNLLVWANMQIKNTNPSIVNISIEDCIDDAINAGKAQAMQKEIVFVKNIAVANVFADYNILEIALRNIITNAVKYSNSNTAITISTHTASDDNFITIHDQGIGISASQINAIMNNEIESTTGTKGEKGSGLGLFLVKELLQKINATLAIESEEGNGSNFIIKMPA